MQLSKVLEHYSLEDFQLIKILIADGIYVDLRSIEQVPDEWFPILSKATNLTPPVDEFAEPVQELEEVELIVARADTLQGLTVLGKIELPKAPEANSSWKKTDDQPGSYVRTRDKGRDKVKKEFFWAYVKFVVPGKGYGFVKRIKDLNNILYPNLLTKDDNDDYYIKVDDGKVKGEQLVLCSCKSDFNGKKHANIESVYFTGLIKNKGKGKRLFDLSSRLCPQSFDLPIGNLQKINEDTQLSFTISFFNGVLHAKEVAETDFEAKINDFGNIAAFRRLSKKESLTDDDLDLIQVLDKFIKDREEVVKAYQDGFAKEKEELTKNADEASLNKFLDKWMLLCPDLLSEDGLNFMVKEGYYLNRWLKGQMPFSFWGEKFDNVCWGYLSENKPQEAYSIFLDLKNILKGNYEIDFTNFVNRYCQSFEAISSSEEFVNLRKIAQTTPEDNTKAVELDLFSKLTPLVKLELWLENKTEHFPRAEAISLFCTCLPVQQERILEHLEDEDFKPILKYLTPANNPSTLQRARQIVEKELLKQLSPLSLDIESDGEDIFELAWGNSEIWVSGINSDEIKDVIDALQDTIIEKDPLLVGHNITDFDCPVLGKNGLRIIKDRVWDTLLVEMALSPALVTYALQTTHHALEDARLTIKLFRNQVLRLLFLDEKNWSFIKNIFPKQTLETVEGLRATMVFGWLDFPEIYTEHLSFFRAQPSPSSLLLELDKKLGASTAKAKVILASADYWEELRVVPGIQFCSQGQSNDRFKELEEEKVLNQLKDHAFEYAVAKRFFSYCRQTSITPLVVNLPPILRLRLSGKVDFAVCAITPAESEWQKEQITCLNIYELARQEEKLLNADNAELFIIEPDLITLTFKVLLKEVALTYVIENPAVKHLWIKFSGGQSFIELSKEQAISLGVEIPDSIENFWIEKFVYGKYRIWGNYNWENHVAGFPSERITIIDRGKADFPKDQAKYLVVDQKKMQIDIGITRFNPESIYRARYWVVQKELIEGITKVENEPLVLLIQRKDELDPIQQYFQSLGYYIPDMEIPLGRRLELLHQSNRSKKIIIATVPEASHIINANYLGPLNFVWDSFNLYENYYLAKGSDLFRKSITESAGLAVGTPSKGEKEGVEEVGSLKVNPSNDNTFLQRDIFFLLKLQVPLINRLRSLLSDDNPASKLWLLDARIEDFASLGDEWNAKKVTFNVWDKKDAYNRDAEIADVCILSPKPGQDLPFSTDEAKEILRSVFLPENAMWHDYQVPYLDKILPAKNNLLVSLPTGGGKSLLFQAPALFRSSFTNRLTIVITPLKALMEDQVKALWDLGFYGSVEYINQDKSDEVLHIYRRLAGGEISLLFITPERFRSGGFIKAFTQRFDNDGGLEYAVYDEAHCISQWGHEFRPDYLYSGKAVQRFKDLNERKFPVLLFSATISEKIYRDLNLIFK